MTRMRTRLSLLALFVVALVMILGALFVTLRYLENPARVLAAAD